jgi:hypothetical protein
MGRTIALALRMFPGDLLPWECGEHDPIDFEGLGRTWSACRCCGFLVEPADRERLLQLMQEHA